MIVTVWSPSQSTDLFTVRFNIKSGQVVGSVSVGAFPAITMKYVHHCFESFWRAHLYRTEMFLENIQPRSAYNHQQCCCRITPYGWVRHVSFWGRYLTFFSRITRMLTISNWSAMRIAYMDVMHG